MLLSNNIFTTSAHYATSVLDKGGYDSLHAERRIKDKTHLVTVDTGVSMTFASLDNAAELLETDLLTSHQERIFCNTDCGRCSLTFWVHVTNVTDEFILALNCPMMHA